MSCFFKICHAIALLAPAIIAVNFGGIFANIAIVTVGITVFFYVRKRGNIELDAGNFSRQSSCMHVAIINPYYPCAGLKSAEVKGDIDEDHDKAFSPSVDNLNIGDDNEPNHTTSLMNTDILQQV